MIDIDNFKLINDTKGHSFGDIILKRLAAILSDAAGADGRAYRIGGDEFVVIIPARNVGNFCNEVKMRMRREDSFTISQGMTALVDDEDAGDSALVSADTALYHVKKNGKNGVCFFDFPRVAQLAAVGAE